MSKIVFFCIPAHGHTNPTLGVVKELVSRGNEVYYYSYEPFREKIESVGAKFISCDDFDMEQKLSPKDSVRLGKELAFSTKILVDTTLALDDKVCAEMEKLKPDVIVADSMAIWGKAVAMKLGIPWVSSTTTFAFNKDSAKIMKQSFGDLIKMIFSIPKIGKEIKRLQDKGYPVKSVLDIIQNDENTETVVYTSPEFQPCSESFSDKYAFVGPIVRQTEREIQKIAEKLIYISMGTVVNDMPNFYKSCIEAFGNSEYQVIMSVGNSVDIKQFENLPENIKVYSHTDQIAVLKKADMFISHCGMNSVSESLYFSVPLLMLPQTNEQKGVANRVLELGAGEMLKNTDAASIKKAAEKVLSNGEYKNNAEEISESFKRCGGAKAAADKILSLCDK